MIDSELQAFYTEVYSKTQKERDFEFLGDPEEGGFNCPLP